jgi:hypothetical protein
MFDTFLSHEDPTEAGIFSGLLHFLCAARLGWRVFANGFMRLRDSVEDTLGNPVHTFCVVSMVISVRRRRGSYEISHLNSSTATRRPCRAGSSICGWADDTTQLGPKWDAGAGQTRQRSRRPEGKWAGSSIGRSSGSFQLRSNRSMAPPPDLPVNLASGQ